MLGSGVNAILTASPTPALAVYPLAPARDVLVLHAGLATERFPATSRSLFQLRPSAAVRADVLGAYAWERGIRRLGVLARQRRLRPRRSRGGRGALATARRPARPRRERVARGLRPQGAPPGRRQARARGRRAGIPGHRARRSRARPPRRRLRGADPGHGRRSRRAPRRRARARRRADPGRRLRSPAGHARRPLRPRVRGPPRPAPVPLRGERVRDGDAPRRGRRALHPPGARRDRLTRLRDVLATGAAFPSLYAGDRGAPRRRHARRARWPCSGWTARPDVRDLRRARRPRPSATPGGATP